MAPSSFVEEQQPECLNPEDRLRRRNYQEKKGKKYEGNPSFSSQEIKDFFEAISKSPSGGIHLLRQDDLRRGQSFSSRLGFEKLP